MLSSVEKRAQCRAWRRAVSGWTLHKVQEGNSFPKSAWKQVRKKNTKFVFLGYFSGIFGVFFRSPAVGGICMCASIFGLFWGLWGFLLCSWLVGKQQFATQTLFVQMDCSAPGLLYRSLSGPSGPLGRKCPRSVPRAISGALSATGFWSVQKVSRECPRSVRGTLPEHFGPEGLERLL